MKELQWRPQSKENFNILVLPPEEGRICAELKYLKSRSCI